MLDENQLYHIPTDLCLYILMRTDLTSMNPGKAVAQGAHAANQMMWQARFPRSNDHRTTAERAEHEFQVTAWANETGDGFGTTITLGCNKAQMYEIVECAQEMGLHAGITHDPTYPVRDGAETYLVPLDTCAYVFASRADVRDLLNELSLMP